MVLKPVEHVKPVRSKIPCHKTGEDKPAIEEPRRVIRTRVMINLEEVGKISIKDLANQLQVDVIELINTLGELGAEIESSRTIVEWPVIDIAIQLFRK